MNLVHREHNDIQKEVKSKTELKHKSNTRFSLTLDDCISVRCRRHININVFCENDTINLGLTRMHADAEKTLQLMKKQLAKFWNNQHADVCC